MAEAEEGLIGGDDAADDQSVSKARRATTSYRQRPEMKRTSARIRVPKTMSWSTIHVLHQCLWRCRPG
jgi:hypothetical protein